MTDTVKTTWTKFAVTAKAPQALQKAYKDLQVAGEMRKRALEALTAGISKAVDVPEGYEVKISLKFGLEAMAYAVVEKDEKTPKPGTLAL